MVTPVMSRLAAEVAARSAQPSPVKSPEGPSGAPPPSAEKESLRAALHAAVQKREEALGACHDLEANLQYMGRTVQSAIRPDRQRASLDRVIGIPIRYSAGFMLGHGGVGLYGLNRYSTFGHLGLSSTLTWARPDTGSVVCLVTTGKPVLGPHIPEMLSMFSALNRFCENRLVR